MWKYTHFLFFEILDLTLASVLSYFIDAMLEFSIPEYVKMVFIGYGGHDNLQVFSDWNMLEV